MAQITTYLKDPAWWFSAFFVAIITSVLASFAKDRVDKAFASISSTMRLRRQRLDAARAAAVTALAENEPYLIMSMIRAAVVTLGYFAFFIMFLLAPMFAEFMETLCAATGKTVSCSNVGRYMSLAAMSVTGGMTIFIGLRMMPIVKTTLEGYRSYRRKRELPPVA